METKPDYPVDIFLKEETLFFDIACIGLEKKDIEITIEGNTLKIAYTKPNVDSNPSNEEAPSYMHRGIVRRSFNMGWKINPNYDLSKLEAVMKNGLLTVSIPITEQAKAKVITIK
jgi:HSP20 family molecular chaperone IbpA